MRGFSIPLFLIAGLACATLLLVGYQHRNDRTVICKEQIVNGQVYANECVRMK